MLYVLLKYTCSIKLGYKLNVYIYSTITNLSFVIAKGIIPNDRWKKMVFFKYCINKNTRFNMPRKPMMPGAEFILQCPLNTQQE